MTQPQEKLLSIIKDRLEDYKKRSADIPEECDWYWVVLARKHQVQVRADSRTLKSLERAGHIKIIEHYMGCYGFNYDIVEVL